LKSINLIILLALAVFISFNLLAQEEDFKILIPKKKMTVKQPAKVSSRKEITVIPESAALKLLEKQGERTNLLLGRFQEKSGVWDFTNEFDFKTGTVIRGILLNSVVSTNLESPLLVEVATNEILPSKTLFSCKGVTKYKRVMAACNKLILPSKDEEYEVQVGLLNLDGSSGLRADEVYTGKEEYVAATIATAFSRGLIELKTERLASPLGELTTNTSRNRLTNGLLNSLDETNDIMKNEMQSKEPKVFIKSGRSVLIYFYERFKL
jgi:hypothetical protein